MHTHPPWLAVSAAWGQEGQPWTLCYECKDRTRPIKAQLLTRCQIYHTLSYNLAPLPLLTPLFFLFFSVSLLSFLDSATSCLSFCQSLPPRTFVSFKQFSPLPVNISLLPLSLIKTVPRSSPRRGEDDKNSSSSASAHWFFLSSLCSIHQITTFLHNNCRFFFFSFCSSLPLSLSLLSLWCSPPNHTHTCLF